MATKKHKRGSPRSGGKRKPKVEEDLSSVDLCSCLYFCAFCAFLWPFLLCGFSASTEQQQDVPRRGFLELAAEFVVVGVLPATADSDRNEIDSLGRVESTHLEDCAWSDGSLSGNA